MLQRDYHDRFRSVVEVAAELFVRGRARPSNSASPKYLRWLLAAPTHIAETIHVHQLHARLRIALEGMTPDSFCTDGDQDSNVIEFATRSPVDPPVTTEDEAEPSRYGWKIAASLAAIALTTLLAMGTAAVQRDRVIETGPSDWRIATLTDGSVVRVGPNTRLHFDFGDNRRSVALKHGEAYFEVAKDPSRPFIVESEPLNVRAVGTAFGVSRRNGRVVVTVREGVVSITQNGKERRLGEGKDGKSTAVSVSASAGQQVTVPGSWPGATKQVDLDRELDWAEGKLIFGDGDTLALAIGEFNQRNRVQIIVNDAALNARQVRGVFRAGDPETFVETVRTRAHVEIVRDRPGVLRLVGEGKAEK